jgi:hypothetical protein
MRSLIIFAFTLGLSTSSFAALRDTVDYWTVTINGRLLINSNITAIMYEYPMKVEMSSFSDNDTLRICFWTDHGSERLKWHFILKDTNDSIIGTFTNSIDSALDRKLRWRKNYIPFEVGYLRSLLKERNIDRILVQIEFEDNEEQNPYRGKSVCVISNS